MRCQHKWEVGTYKTKHDVSYTSSVCILCGEPICVLPTLNFLPLLTSKEFDDLVEYLKEKEIIIDASSEILDNWR